MKKNILKRSTWLLIFTFIFCFGAKAQVYTGNLVLGSQWAVDHFSYTEVTGYITINGADITDLSPMSSLTSVGTQLNIYGNNLLSSLAGLNNLASVGTDLVIHGNNALTSLEGLNNLASVGGRLMVYENNVLTSLAGLGNLATVGGDYMQIYDNAVLTSLAGLENLTSLSLDLTISNNDVLGSLAGLGNLATLRGDLEISDNDALSSLTGLDNLATIVGSVVISNNGAMTSLTGLEKISTLRGSLHISENNALSSLAGLNNLTSLLGSLFIDNNIALPNLQGLGNLVEVEAYLTVSHSSALTSLAGLDNLSSVGSSLTIQYNPVLTSLAGVENLASVGGKLSILYCDVLTSIEGLGSLTSIKDLSISHNPLLTSFAGLENITSLEGGVSFSTNPALTSLAGLGNLTSVGADLVIIGDNGVTNLSGLETLTSVGGDLRILNTNLSSLAGLENLNSVGTNADIQGNDNLTSLGGLESLSSIGGTLDISSNAALTSLAGLGNLASVGESIQIYLSPALTSLAGLGNLTSVGTNLSINSNNALVSLAGIDNLASVGGDLRIYRNTVLTSLTGLENLTSIGLYIRIYENAALTSLEGLENITSASAVLIYENDVLSSFCALYGLLSGGGLTGVYNVSNNAVNPTKQEIIDNGPCTSNSPPVAVCQNVSVPADENCQATVTAADIDNGSTDPDGDEISLSISPEGPYSIGVTNVILTVDNGNDETATCEATVTVYDDLPPVAPPAPADLILECASDVPPPVDLTATDNCDGEITASPTAQIMPGGCANNFVVVRTWTFVDAGGNTSSVSQTITVNDNTPPVISNTENIEVPNSPDACGAIVHYPTITATDNCSGDVVPSINPPSGTLFPVGSTTVNVSASDACGNSSLETFVVTVTNEVPDIISLSAPLDPVPTNELVTVTAISSDNNIKSTQWDWGDGTPMEEIIGSQILGEHYYSEAGVYTINLRVTDHCEAFFDYAYQYIVVYDPEGGFVTGGGWIDSPEGALVGNVGAVGIANFGFVSKYKNGSTIPTGNTEFQFKAGDLNFNSSVYDWLVIAGFTAKFKGEGTINGGGIFGFMISAVDGDLSDDGKGDRFRIKIWDKLNGDAIVYDNQIGDDEDTEPNTELGGGSIVIHKAKIKKSAPVIDPEAKISIYPNPFDNSIYVDLISEAGHDILIDLVDMNGRVVAYLYTGIVKENVEHHFEMTTSDDLIPGYYTLRIRNAKGEYFGRKLVLKQ